MKGLFENDEEDDAFQMLKSVGEKRQHESKPSNSSANTQQPKYFHFKRYFLRKSIF